MAMKYYTLAEKEANTEEKRETATRHRMRLVNISDYKRQMLLV
jgi:hypothetical protein